MTPADKPEFVKQLIGLAAIKPGGSKLTPESYEIWFNAMRDWTLDEFKAAASHLATAVEFMPSPFHFAELRKAGRPVTAEAWIEARALAKTWRPNMAAPRSDDDLINHAVESIGGYRAIAMCNTDALGFLEKRFTEAFESMQDAADVREAVPQIAHERPRTRVLGPRSMREGLQRLVVPRGDE